MTVPASPSTSWRSPGAADSGRRPATGDDLDALVPAAAEDFREEVGVDAYARDPSLFDGVRASRSRRAEAGSGARTAGSSSRQASSGLRRPSSSSRCGWSPTSAGAATGSAASPTSVASSWRRRPPSASSCGRRTRLRSPSTTRSGCGARSRIARSSSGDTASHEWVIAGALGARQSFGGESRGEGLASLRQRSSSRSRPVVAVVLRNRSRIPASPPTGSSSRPRT